MPYNFYETLSAPTDRAWAILVHWGQGNILCLPYTSISPAYVSRRGELVIYAGMIVLRARLGRPQTGETLSLSGYASALDATVPMRSCGAPTEQRPPSADEPLDRPEYLGAITKHREPSLGVTVPLVDSARALGPSDQESLTPPVNRLAAVPLSAARAPAQTPGTEQTLEQFALDLQGHRVLALYNLPEAGFFVDLFQLTQKGEKPFEA